MTEKERLSSVGAPDVGSLPLGPAMHARGVGSGVGIGEAEVVVALPPTAIPQVTTVRSTLIASSLQTVREASLLGAYMQALPTRYHEEVMNSLAPVWLPLDAAMAHYRAMDSLRLSDEQILKIGRSVGERVHGTFLGTLVRGVRHAGVTPWSIAGKIDRIWSRVFEGGAIGASKLGPKDGVLSVRGLPLLQFRYFRIGWRGVLCTSVEMLAQRCYVRENGLPMDPDAIDFVVSWV